MGAKYCFVGEIQRKNTLRPLEEMMLMDSVHWYSFCRVGFSQPISRKERIMDTNHPATAGPNVAINVDILKTSIDDNTFNDLRRLGSAAAAPG